MAGSFLSTFDSRRTSRTSRSSRTAERARIARRRGGCNGALTGSRNQGPDFEGMKYNRQGAKKRQGAPRKEKDRVRRVREKSSAEGGARNAEKEKTA
jgi:hypothetical protein